MKEDHGGLVVTKSVLLRPDRMDLAISAFVHL